MNSSELIVITVYEVLHEKGSEGYSYQKKRPPKTAMNHARNWVDSYATYCQASLIYLHKRSSHTAAIEQKDQRDTVMWARRTANSRLPMTPESRLHISDLREPKDHLNAEIKQAPKPMEGEH